jgi:hypothetical protein
MKMFNTRPYIPHKVFKYVTDEWSKENLNFILFNYV